MLKFFRKYQKIFFAFIAFIVVITFSFFGTQGITTRISKPKDKDISIAYNGSVIKLSDIENMSYFLSTDSNDISLVHSHVRANLFNDGVIKNDIIRSGIAKIFIEKYFDQIKDSFKTKFEIIQRYKPFVHFNDPSISLANTLQMIDPKVLTLLKDLQDKKELNLDFFNTYIDLYNEQTKIQSELLRKILIYQERQNKIEADPRLYQDSITLFGFESTIDWFGKDFIDLISQFIINTALFAKEKGYEVTQQEALVDLTSNLKKALNNQMKESITEYFKKMLSSLNMDEKKAINIWKNVLLFRKYFKDVSNNTLIDSLAYKEFANYSRAKANIKLYKLPASIQFKNFEDLIRFEMYLIATTNKSNPLDVPNNFKSIEEIEKKYPQLVEKKYLVNVKQTNLDNVALKVKVKDMVLWQLEDKNWGKLKNKFSFIAIAKTNKDKLDVIEKLDLSQKLVIDAFSRKEIVKENPQMIDETLRLENEKEYDFYFSKDTSIPIQIKDTDKLLQLLDSQDKIEKYTEDNNNYFSFVVVQRPTQKSLVTFEKALKNNIIDKILDTYLQSQYLKIKETDSQRFREEKDFDRVELAQIVFEDVFNKLKLLNLSKDKSLDNLAQNRLYLFVENAMKNIYSNANYLETLNPQFRILCENKEISRSKNQTWLEKTAFSMEEKKYSCINTTNMGDLEFFYLESFKQADISPEKIEIAKNAFSIETSTLLARKLIKTFIDKKCIVLLVRD